MTVLQQVTGSGQPCSPSAAFGSHTTPLPTHTGGWPRLRRARQRRTSLPWCWAARAMPPRPASASEASRYAAAGWCGFSPYRRPASSRIGTLCSGAGAPPPAFHK